ncbi:hypothetical protein JCM10049v2_002684 [Rhodotorula toruloides]
MNPFDRLPDELLRYIFDFLSVSKDPYLKGDLRRCLFVCQRFYQLARPLLWRRIHVHSKRDLDLVLLDKRTGDTSEYTTSLCLANKMSFKEGAASKEDFEELVGFLPRVKDVSLHALQLDMIPFDAMSSLKFLTTLSIRNVSDEWTGFSSKRLVSLEIIGCRLSTSAFLTQRDFPHLRALSLFVQPTLNPFVPTLKYAELDTKLLVQLDMLQLPLQDALASGSIWALLQQVPTLLFQWSGGSTDRWRASPRFWRKPNLVLIEHVLVERDYSSFGLHISEYSSLKTVSIAHGFSTPDVAGLVKICLEKGIEIISVGCGNDLGVKQDFWAYAKREKEALKRA